MVPDTKINLNYNSQNTVATISSSLKIWVFFSNAVIHFWVTVLQLFCSQLRANAATWDFSESLILKKEWWL